MCALNLKLVLDNEDSSSLDFSESLLIAAGIAGADAGCVLPVLIARDLYKKNAR